MDSKLLKRLDRRPVAQDEDAVQRLIALLASEDSYLRREAVQLLIRAGESAVPELIEALGDTNPLVWQHATVALLKIGDEAVPALVEALENSHESIRMYSAAILQRMGRPAPDEPGFAGMWREYGRLLALQRRRAEQRQYSPPSK